MKIPAQRQRVILYYPRVLITPGPWLKQALLYWDSIGSIVPQNLERLIYNDRWMRELTDEGVFHSFRPEEVFNQNPDLDSALFIELQEKFIRKRYLTRFRHGWTVKDLQHGWTLVNGGLKDMWVCFIWLC